jgi:uncharacterized protein (DUF924 family)
MDAGAREILEFWNGIGPAGWYRADDAVDETIRSRFGGPWEAARQGGFGSWASEPASCLALAILLDQFPRNMFRGDARSFATDARARELSTWAIARGCDLRIEGPERQFFYTPLMHSEVLTIQDRSVRLYLMRFGRGELLRHARAHREIIRRFGRFPYRNAVLGRTSTPEEVAFLEAGGYVKALEGVAA